MRNRSGRKILNLFLSALVLAWGTAPPASQHAHVGGKDPTHQHDGCQEVAHHGLHDHDSDGQHHQRAVVPDVSLVSDFVAHVHLRWLGMEFSLPLPDESADGDDEGTVPPAIVRVMDEIVPATQAGPSFGRPPLTVISAHGVDLVPNLTPIPRPRQTASIPLCDSARLERSGVLLA